MSSSTVEPTNTNNSNNESQTQPHPVTHHQDDDNDRDHHEQTVPAAASVSSSSLSPQNLRAHRRKSHMQNQNQNAPDGEPSSNSPMMMNNSTSDGPQWESGLIAVLDTDNTNNQQNNTQNPEEDEDEAPEKVRERKFDSPNRTRAFDKLSERVDQEGTNDNTGGASSTVDNKKVVTIFRKAPYKTSWFQWKPTDEKQLEHAEKMLLAPVAGRFIQEKVATLNTLSFVPNTYIVDKLKQTLMKLKSLMLSDEEKEKEKEEKAAAASIKSPSSAKKKNASSANNTDASDVDDFDVELLKNHVVLRHVVLFHGMGAGSCIWLPQLKHFGDLFDKKNLFAANETDGLLQLDEEFLMNNNGNSGNTNDDDQEENNGGDGDALDGILSSDDDDLTDCVSQSTAGRRNQQRPDFRASFFGSSFVTPGQLSSSTTNNNNAHNKNSKNNKKQNKNNLPSSMRTLEDERRAAKLRKELRKKKVVINILHAADLPGYARSGRDEEIDGFASAHDANFYMISKLSKWSDEMDFDNVEKWILKTKLKPRDTIVRAVDLGIEDTLNAVALQKQKEEQSPSRRRNSQARKRTASSSSPSPRKNNNNSSKSSQPDSTTEEGKELSIRSGSNNNNARSTKSSSPTKQSTRARSVVVVNAPDDQKQTDEVKDTNNNDNTREESPQPNLPTFPVSSIANDDDDTNTNTHQQQNNNEPSKPPARIGADYSFRRKSGVVDQHLRKFEESTRDSRRRSLSHHTLNQPSSQERQTSSSQQGLNNNVNANNDDDQDDEETDDDSNSDNEYYKAPEDSTRFHPQPQSEIVKRRSVSVNNNTNNNNQSTTSFNNSGALVPVDSSSSLSAQNRRNEMRSSKFIPPGEDATFQKKRRSQSSMDRSLNSNNKNNNRDTRPLPERDIAVFETQEDESKERELVEEFLSKKMRRGHRHHVTVIAHSYGAYLSGHLACERPELINHLILADCWGMVARPDETEDQEFYKKLHPCLTCVDCCYQCSKALPFGSIRKLGSWGPSFLSSVRSDFADRWKTIVASPNFFFDFVYHANAQEPPTGEIAITAASEKFGFAVEPLQPTLIKRLPIQVDLSLIYGDKTFMDRGAGFDLTEILKAQREKVYEAGKKIVEEELRKEEAEEKKLRERRDTIRKEIEDAYDREYGDDRRQQEDEEEQERKRIKVEKRLPRIGKLSYETVFKAGHQVTTDNVAAFNKLAQGMMEM